MVVVARHGLRALLVLTSLPLIVCGGGGGSSSAGLPPSAPPPPSGEEEVSEPQCSPTPAKGEMVVDLEGKGPCKIAISYKITNGRCSDLTVDYIVFRRDRIQSSGLWRCSSINRRMHQGEVVPAESEMVFSLYSAEYCETSNYFGESCGFDYISLAETSFGSLERGATRIIHDIDLCPFRGSPGCSY